MRPDKKRAIQIIGRLYREFEGVLEDAVQIALRQSIPAVALVQELEEMGYQVTTTINFLVVARPLEAVFEESLTEGDRQFLREPRPDMTSEPEEDGGSDESRKAE